jgi:spermidine/putrescine transport system substrate-binding protein
MTARPPEEPDHMDQLDPRPLTRRSFLRAGAGGMAAMSLASFLAACGNDGTSSGGSGGAAPTAADGGVDWASAKEAGRVTMANWPYYIDQKKLGNGQVAHPTLDDFERTTGIDVDYREIIQSYEEFHAKILPLLQNGQSTGFDVIVTGFPKWFPLLISRGVLVELDHSLLPNYEAHGADKYKNVSYDPGNHYGIPFESGMTGIGYNIDITGRELTSVDELFSDEWSGKVGMFRDTLDTPSIALIANGVNPAESTEDDWQAAADLLIQQRDAGIVRQYYGQGYVDALENEEVAVSLAWGGDILQAQNRGYDNLRFVVPDEGGMLWTDIMAIPVGVEHPLDAITLMDWFYKPEVAAGLTAYIQSICPVPEAQDILREQGDPVAESPLVFPTDEIYSRLRDYRILDGEENDTWDGLFLPVYQS